MRFDKFTTLAQEAVAAAQNLAASSTHPEITPLHLLAALLAEKGSNAATILQKAGVDPSRVASVTEAEMRRLPKVQGASTGNASRDLVEVLGSAERDAQKMKDAYVSTEHLLLALADVKSGAKEVLSTLGVDRKRVQAAVEAIRKASGVTNVTDQNPEATYQALKKYGRDLAEMARKGKLDPVIGRDEEIRRVHAGALAPHEEQPRPHRRARRRQDRDRRRACAAHRERRRAPSRCKRQAHRRARPRRSSPARSTAASSRSASRPCSRKSRERRARSSSSSTSCTRSSARARRGRDRTPPTCSSPRSRAASCAASARPRSTSTASTSRRTRRSSAGSSRCSSASRRVEDTIAILRGLKERYEIAPRRAHPGRALVVAAATLSQPLHHRPLPAGQGDRPRRRGRVEAADRDRLDAGRARRGRAPHHAARDRARGAQEREGHGEPRSASSELEKELADLQEKDRRA